MVRVLLLYSLWLLTCELEGVCGLSKPERRNQLMPNLYFIGVSKCGTSTMARVLTEHPLITAVGVKNNPSSESKILEKYPPNKIGLMNKVQTDRVATNINLKNKTSREQILDSGIIMHYTPNYAMSKLALQNLCTSVGYYDSSEKAENKKFLIMLRNPNTRTPSSWWFKEWSGRKPGKSIQTPFQRVLEDGMQKDAQMRKCFKSFGFNFSDLVNSEPRIDFEALRNSQVLTRCPLSILNWANYDERRAHVGKSLYPYMLVHWMEKIPLESMYIMSFEGFVRDPAHEMELFLSWLKIPTYGDLGYSSPQHIKRLATELHTHNRPINRSIAEVELDPWRVKMQEFFSHSILELQHILGNYLRQKIQNNECEGTTDHVKLLQLGESNSGHWGDAMELLEGLHQACNTPPYPIH